MLDCWNGYRVRLLIVVNVDWFFLSHRLPVALAAKEAGWEVHVATTLTEKGEGLANHGLHIHPLHIDRTTSNPVSLLRLGTGLFRLFREIDPDVLHLVTIKPVLIGGAAGRLARSRAVVYAFSGLGHVFSANGRLSRIRRSFVVGAYKFALGNKRRRLIFQNQSDMDEITSAAGVPLDDCMLIPGSGFEVDEVRPSPPPAGPHVFLMAARLLHTKGVMEYCEAAKEVASKRDDVEFWLVGEPDDSNPASLTADDLSVIEAEGVVKILGFRNDVPELMRHAHAVVLPSYYAEGLPKVLIEAAAMARPIITTDTPGCRAAVEANVTGLIVRPHSSRALAEAMIVLVDDDGRARRMGTAGRERAKKLFRIEDVTRAHLDAYAELGAKA